MIKFKSYFFIIPLAISTSFSIGIIVDHFFFQPKEEQNLTSTASSAKQGENCDYTITRLGGYNLIKPIQFAQPNCEAEKYSPINSDMAKLAESYKNQGLVTSLAIYLRDFTKGDWTGVNYNEKFYPGSIVKIATMMTVLKKAEKEPGLLSKEVSFEKPFNLKKEVIFKPEQAIQVGKKYTVRDLLRYMIVYSDNNSSMLLYDQKIVTLGDLSKTLQDIGISSPDIKDPASFRITAYECSQLLAAIFNVAYLTIPDSEYAMELLSETDFKEAIRKGIPNGIKVTDKFGEAGNTLHPELSETAIIYLNNSPYLITIMARGYDIHKLPEVVENISKVVFSKMEQINS